MHPSSASGSQRPVSPTESSGRSGPWREPDEEPHTDSEPDQDQDLGTCGRSYQDTEEVEVLCSPGVVPTLVLELSVPVERVQILLTEL